MLLHPKPVTIECNDGSSKEFILHKFPAIPGREIVSQYPLSAMPKLGDYIATRIADVSSSRTTCSPMNHLTGTTLTNNIAEQDSMP